MAAKFLHMDMLKGNNTLGTVPPSQVACFRFRLLRMQNDQMAFYKKPLLLLRWASELFANNTQREHNRDGPVYVL